MILGFDVGNSTTVIGVYANDPGYKLVNSLRIVSNAQITPDELFFKVSSLLESKGIVSSQIDSAIYSSVVPSVDFIYRTMLKEGFQVDPLLEVRMAMKSNLEFRYENLSEIGADRIVNAVAAYDLYGEQGNLIVIDFGTATTFCVILKEGIYQGGVIAPGLRMSMEALFQKTAKLPMVPFEKPDFVIGTNTRDSIQSGFYFGWSSMIEGMIALIERQMQRNFQVILTGGYSSLVSKGLDRKHIIDEDITLKGLKKLYDLNS